MAISKVRQYIKEGIASINSNLREWDSPFDGDNIPETLADNSFYISYEVPTSTSDQQTVTDTVEAEVGFYFKAFNKEITKYDEAMDLVNAIRNKLLSKTNIQAFADTDDNPIAGVSSLGMNGDFIDSNKKQIKITLTLDMTIYQVIC